MGVSGTTPVMLRANCSGGEGAPDQGAHAGSHDDVRNDPLADQGSEHADVGEAAGGAAAQGKAQSRSKETSHQKYQVTRVLVSVPGTGVSDATFHPAGQSPSACA